MVHALVVDDDIRAAETVRRMLVSDGWAVTLAFDGPEGLWRATEGSYDVIMLDIMMPGMNGYRVLQNLREREVWTPVLMLSAKDGEYDQAEALDCGADDYLVKPFSVVVLKARLRALLRRGAPERPATLRVGDLFLDPAEHLVRRGDTPITLTPREYAVLECLIRHAGTVVSKTDILHSVWDENYEGDPNIIEVYIGYLRKRIDQPFGVHSIETVRGVGYRIG
ncbi:response regulator transcription factor [Gordonia sp. GONU]|uniref:response regulator transcription factor n=1 Tax=Gordonia TaxID=2053 RepID=UPI0004133050|nr:MULTISPECIES: response regulator transcription factor [Gordonia]MCR8897803.1 response regulator transcription factor [Gordonia sp. GONU]MCZ0912017.1 response regulator transcription factor [Gordonia amicalis]MCZ4651859.1 response regulator transcription factor [Gordonia amicalis]UKO93506.1 response regulator transcription factor [Gordonia amicalis]